MAPPTIKAAPPADPELKNRGQSQSTVQPSVFELAALTTDLDTQGITARIKEVLVANNIGQKLFGEAVLGLSQVSLSQVSLSQVGLSQVSLSQVICSLHSELVSLL